GIAAVVVAVVAAALVFVGNKLDGVVAQAVEDYGSAATGTRVTVAGVDVTPTQGRGELKALVIDNPPGFETDHALRIEDVKLSLDLRSLTGDVPVVHEVLVDDAHLNAEQRGDSTNLTDIERYMSKSSETSGDSSVPPPRLIIDRFRLTHARVTLTSELLDHPEELELGDVTVQNIGRSAGGATYDEATEAVLTPILDAARAAVQQRLKEAAASAAREEVEQRASDKLKSLFDKD
ncbi:MAG TPA: hypothetical protein VFO94_13535, partial [Gammaproteobacteria bacterium]|nr:hypothetical protein [Gammaproteobacteria bacterium]